MSSSDEKDLSLVLQTQEKRDMNPNITNRVISEMKGSLLFQSNWEELLMSAPVALSCLGGCYVASSSSTEAESIIFETPTGGFKYLRWPTLRANLTECGDLGRTAFIEAESGMGKIQLVSRVVYGKVGDIVDSLSDPPTAKKLLRPQMNALKNDADECFQAAQRIDAKFDAWLMYVCEMHAACVQQSSSTQEKLNSTAINLAAENTKLEYTNAAVGDAKKATTMLEKQLDTASQAYKMASDKFPSGWDILGQQIVSSLADCVTTALNQAIPVLVDSLNPLKKVKAGADIVGGFVNPKKGDDKTSTEKPGNTAVPSAPTQPNPRPQESTDPAYAQVARDIIYLSTLNVILTTGTDGTVAWEKAKGNSSDPDKTSNIAFVRSMLADAKSSFTRVATDKAPSESYSDVLNVTEKASNSLVTFVVTLTRNQIASEILTEVKKAKSIDYKWPAKDSAEVKNWQRDFEDSYATANQMNATAKSFPGTPANGIPLMANVDPSVQIAQANAKSTQAQAVLESAKNRLNTTQQAFLTTQQIYLDSTKMLVEQENKLTEVKSTLAKLNAGNMSLAEIKVVLIECIKLVIALKEQITNLVRFFKAVATIIEVAVKYHVDPFLETIKASVAADGTDPNKHLMIGDFTFTDLQRSNVYNSTLMIRSYFGVFGDIAGMWVKLSLENVSPGVALCEELSRSTDERDKGATASKAKRLTDWSRKAQENIKSIAGEKQKEILSTMDSRVEEIAEVTKMLPPPPLAIRKAINQGATEVKEAASQALEAKNKASPLSRFSSKGGPPIDE